MKPDKLNNDANSEHRRLPRQAVKLPLKIDARTPAQLVNISDGGLCFLSADQTLQPNHLIRIRVGARKVLFSARIRWTATVEKIKDGLVCGAAFEDLTEDMKNEIVRIKTEGVHASL